MTSWQQVSPGGRAYADRFAALERSGADVHGEADLVERLAPAGGRVLDAGCGTGRVGIRLHRRGFRAEGVDVDADMLAVARETEPEIRWYEADLADLRTAAPGPYDVVIAAAHLPVSSTLDLAGYDRCCAAAGLTLRSRHRSWRQEPYDGGGYAVSIHAANLRE